jgi:hypothetical protein
MIREFEDGESPPTFFLAARMVYGMGTTLQEFV